MAGLEGRDRRTGPTGSGGHSGLQLTGSGNEWAALSLINEECTLSYEETCVKSTPTRWPQCESRLHSQRKVARSSPEMVIRIKFRIQRVL